MKWDKLPGTPEQIEARHKLCNLLESGAYAQGTGALHRKAFRNDAAVEEFCVLGLAIEVADLVRNNRVRQHGERRWKNQYGMNFVEEYPCRAMFGVGHAELHEITPPSEFLPYMYGLPTRIPAEFFQSDEGRVLFAEVYPDRDPDDNFEPEWWELNDGARQWTFPQLARLIRELAE